MMMSEQSYDGCDGQFAVGDPSAIVLPVEPVKPSDSDTRAMAPPEFRQKTFADRSEQYR